VCDARWDGLHSIRSALTPDPQLSNIGVEQAKKAGRVLHAEIGLRPDAVLCSGLTRAVETALFAFGPASPYQVCH
jgi:broad specificity phosphatase PhoE